MVLYIAIIFIIIIVLAVVLIVRRQQSLRSRAYLMQEAMRNRDFTFRLPTRGLLFGERAMQDTLNQLGDTIQQQVSLNEVEAWERLIRVLTHEIMNATAPIVSISQSLLNRADVKDTPLEEGIRAVHTTSQYLTAFVESYRKLSQLQQPIMGDVHIASLVKDVAALYPDLQWTCTIADTTIVKADPNMLRQILVNLVKNAVEAGAQCISVEESQNPTTLYVSNDGSPISPDARRNIFVPFFTTKRTGYGIGLPLSRRMMVQQGGMLDLADISRSGHATFVLQWLN